MQARQIAQYWQMCYLMATLWIYIYWNKLSFLVYFCLFLIWFPVDLIYIIRHASVFNEGLVRVAQRSLIGQGGGAETAWVGQYAPSPHIALLLVEGRGCGLASAKEVQNILFGKGRE